MDDIEDLFKFEVAEEQQRPTKHKVKRAKVIKKKPEETPEPAAAEEKTVTRPEVVPGNAKIFVKTYGCSHNISDSEYMAGLLQDYGY